MIGKVSIETLAEKLKLSVDELYAQFKAANMRVAEGANSVSEMQANKIEAYVKDSRKESLAKSEAVSDKKPMSLKKADPSKITLKRKTKSTLQVTGVQKHSAKAVNVEVRKKRTYMKRGALLEKEVKEQETKVATAPHVSEKTDQTVLPSKSEDEFVEVQVEKPAVETEAGGAKKPVEVVAPGIDRDVVKANLEREKRMAKLLAKEEGEKAKRRAKAAKAAKDQRVGKRIDLRNLDLSSLEEGESQEAEMPLQKKTSTVIDISRLKIKKQQFEKPTAPVIHEVLIPEIISVGDLAHKMSVKAAEVVRVLMKMGVMATINQTIDRDTAFLVVEEMGHTPKAFNENVVEDSLSESFDTGHEKVSRPPVVTIMGHVDHGKTKLLDAIRKSKIAEKEAGGITQHIGAYHVKTEKGIITFLDTPGHEAFTAMRARGAKVTDIVVLVVAADDGVMPQTVEAIEHAKAAGVPIIIAVNKIDKPEADPEKVKTELSNYNVVPEEWGGENMFVNISAKQVQGIDELLDAILLQAEVLELTAIAEGKAKGIVLESKKDKGRGVLTSVLVMQGMLKVGDVMLAGMYFGRVRLMLDESGKKVPEAGPAIPVEVLGLPETPMAGDDFFVVDSEAKAREIALHRENKFKEAKVASQGAVKLENLFDDMKKEAGLSVLNIVLKTDVQGSLEALKESLNKISTDEVAVNIIASGVGGITTNDVNLALASKAIIIGFNVRADASAKKVIEDNDVDVRYHSIIYNVMDEVKQALSGLLSPEVKEKIIGVANVREVFRSSKFGVIAGCMVTEGIIKRNRPIRILRDNVVIFEGELDSLRRFKEDANEVRQNMECGIGVKNYQDIKVGDQIEVFERTEVERKLQ